MLTKLLLRYLRFLARHSAPEEPMYFWDELAKVKTALIALPSSLEEIKALDRRLERLIKLFAPGEVAFIALQGQSLPRSVGLGQVIEVRPESLRFGRFPRQSLRAQVKARHTDAFIDLHCDFDLVSATLAVASGARIRMCLAHEERDPFFNLQVRTSRSAAPAKRYQRLLALLEASRVANHPATPVSEGGG